MTARFPRSPRALLPAAAVALALVLGACTGQQQPTEYGDAYEENFMYTCTGVEPNSAGQYENPTLAPASECRCIYEGLVEKVPFDEAKAYEEKQEKADPDDVPAPPKNIQAVIDDCQESSGES